MPLKVVYTLYLECIVVSLPICKKKPPVGEECRGLENEMGGCDIQSNYTMCVLLLKELMLPKTLSPCLRILEFLRAAIELYFLGILRILNNYSIRQDTKGMTIRNRKMRKHTAV